MVCPERLMSMLCVIYSTGSEPKMGSNVVRGEVEATVGKFINTIVIVVLNSDRFILSSINFLTV